jgi:hypothetical protein
MPDQRNGVARNRLPPTGARRALILGFQDGPLDGVLETSAGDTYRFDVLSETHNPDGQDRRSYLLKHLPSGTLDQCAQIIGEYIPPNWPTWLPIWRFPNATIEAQVAARIDAILEQAGPDEWEVTVGDPDGLAVFVDSRPRLTCESRN